VTRLTEGMPFSDRPANQQASRDSRRANLNLRKLIESIENTVLQRNRKLAADNSVDATFWMDFAWTVFDASDQVAAVKSIQGYQRNCQMTNSDQTHPLGDEETDQINPAVAEELTPAQIEWLTRQSVVVGRKKLQILRQALFEWVGEHLEYRFTEARFGDTVRCALEAFINRHRADVLLSKADSGPRSSEPGRGDV
jgi:hypothetical protein